MIPQDVCLDANIFVSLLDPGEKYHEDSVELVKALKNELAVFHEPAIVIPEVTSAIHRKVCDGRLPPEIRDELIDLCFGLPLLLQWNAGVMKKSGHIASELSFKRTYDCNYLALAASSEIPLITQDVKFLKRAKNLYQRVFTIEQFLRKFG